MLGEKSALNRNSLYYTIKPMPRIISSYIFKEMAVPFLMVIAVLAITSLLSKTLKLVELVINHGVGLAIVIKFIMFIMPSFLIYIIPMSFLIAVLITFNRLSSDNEITAMKASGLNILKMSMPVVFMALLAYIMSAFFAIYAFPWGNISSKRLIYDVVRSKAGVGLKERTFNDAFDGLILYADRIMPESGKLQGIFLSDRRDAKDSTIIAAKDGIIMSDQKTMKITLRLFNGTTHRSGDKGLYTIITFNTYDLNLSLKEDRVKNPDTSKTNRDLTIRQLKERIADVKTAGEDPAPHIIDLHKRFALPASVFIFGILGIPLGIQRVRTTKFTSFTVGLGIVLFYYILSTALESLGEKGMLNPVLAVWGSDIFMFLIGIYIFYKTTKDSPIKSLAWLEEKKEIIALALKNISRKRKK